MKAQDKHKHAFCGPAGLRPAQIFHDERPDSAFSWFEGNSVHYVHKARTAIRRACTLLDMWPGDEILAPAYNCGSEVDALLSSELSVVFYKVDRRSTIDLSDLRKRITRKTKAIYITHYFGFPQPANAVKLVCAEYGLNLIEDCALSLFSTDGDNKLGSTGDISVFSFPKTLPVPDGGALVVNNPALEVGEWRLRAPKRMPILRSMLPLVKASLLRGLSRRTLSYPLYRLLVAVQRAVRSSAKAVAADAWSKMPETYYYSVEMTDRGMSLMTHRLLSRFDFMAIVEKRRANFRRYLELFSEASKITPLFRELPSGICPLHFPVIMDRRNQVCADLNDKGVDAIPWWAGYHRNLSWNEFDDARFLKDNLLALPVHQDLEVNEVEFIAECLLAAS
jgi:perosamine synthetase